MIKLILILAAIHSTYAFSYNCKSNCDKEASTRFACPTFGNWSRTCPGKDPIIFTACVAAKQADCRAIETKKLIGRLVAEKNKLARHYSRTLTLNKAAKKKNDLLRSSEKKLKASKVKLTQSIKEKKVVINALTKGLDGNILLIKGAVARDIKRLADIRASLDLSQLPLRLQKAIKDSGEALSDATKAIQKTPLGKGVDKVFVDIRDFHHDLILEARDVVGNNIKKSSDYVEKVTDKASNWIYDSGEDAASYWHPRWEAFEDSVMANIDEETCEYKQTPMLGEYPSRQRKCFDKRALSLELKKNKLMKEIEIRRRSIEIKFKEQLEKEF